MNSQIKQVLRSFYVLEASIGAGFGFTFAVYATFLMSQGLSLLEINIVNFFYFITIFLLEIPTGAFADTYGRKKSLIVSASIFSLGMLVYSFSTSFYGFITAEIISGIGYTFLSGAKNAWFIDELHVAGHAGSTKVHQAKAGQWRLLASVLTTFIGSYIYAINPSFPFVCTAIMFAITGVVVILIPETTYVRVESHTKEKITTMWKTALRSVSYTRTHKHAQFFIVVGCVQAFAYMALNMQWQQLLTYDFESIGKGVVANSIKAALFFGGWLVAHRLLKKVADNHIVIVALTGAGLTIFITAFAAHNAVYFALFAFLLHEMCRAIIGPAVSSYIHEHIPSSDRATIESASSVYTHLAGAIGLLLSGYLAETIGIPLTWAISATVLTCAGVYLWYSTKTNR